MSQTRKLLQNPAEKKQKLLTRTREALKNQKKKSNQPASGKITSYQVKQLDKLYTKGSVAFGSTAKLKKASGIPELKLAAIFSRKPSTRNKDNSGKDSPD